MWSKIAQYISNHNLLNANNLYLVALSGGADSVALLLLLCEQGYKVEAVHCNFHLRGDESDRDERFCAALCRQLNVTLHQAHFDTKTYAELHKLSIEMAARELRYTYFERLRQDVGADGICVAHHRDDSVETVLMNLMRGTGLRGLCGIRPRNGYILRPMLCVSRAEIESFLADRKQAYVTDSTNLVTDATRNKIRLQLLPVLKSINPAVVENILRTTEHLLGAQAVLDAELLCYMSGNRLEISEFKDNYSREYIAFEWLKKYGFNGTQAQQILTAETGRVFSSPAGFDVLADRGCLLVEPSLEPMKPMKIPEEGIYALGLNEMFALRKTQAYVSKDPNVATLDAAKVKFPFIVRRAEVGDKMQPYGMKGKKLLSDLMTDRKMTLFDKRRRLVVVDAQGCVVWAVGLRVDGRVAVTPQTAEVLEFKFYYKSTSSVKISSDENRPHADCV